MSEIKNGRLGLYGAEHVEYNHVMTLGFKGINLYFLLHKLQNEVITKQISQVMPNKPVCCSKSFACFQHSIALLYQLNDTIFHGSILTLFTVIKITATMQAA